MRGLLAMRERSCAVVVATTRVRRHHPLRVITLIARKGCGEAAFEIDVAVVDVQLERPVGLVVLAHGLLGELDADDVGCRTLARR